MTEGRARQRVLVLASTYPRWQDDPEPAFVHQLSKRLAQSFDVTVLCPHAAGALSRERMDGVDVIRFRYAPQVLETLVNNGGIATNLKRAPWKWVLVPAFLSMQFLSALRTVKKLRPDVIHAHWIIPQGLAAAFLRSFGRMPPVVITSHGADLFAFRGHLVSRLKRFALARAAHLTVVSSAMRGEADKLGMQPARVSILPMGVDLSRFTPDPAKRDCDSILFVGRLVEKKGLALLLKAMPFVLERRPDAVLTIVGFGPMLASLREQAEQLRIAQSVTFVGAVPQSALPAYYQRATVFVAPFIEAAGGDQEGLGLVAIEAAACGASVILGNVGATADFVGEKGFVRVDARDTSALVTEILDRLETCVTERSDVPDRARLAQRFGWDTVARSYEELLHSAVAAKNH